MKKEIMTDSIKAYKAEIDYMRELLKTNQNETQRLQHLLMAKEKIIKSQQKKLTDIERIQKELIHEYEQQVSCLKNEIGHLKLSHERLLTKFKQEQQKLSLQRGNGENMKMLQDINSLNYQLRASNQRQTTLQEQIDTLEADRSRLSERCHFLQTELVKLKMDNAQTVSQLSELKLIQKNFDWKESLYEKLRQAKNVKLQNSRGTQTKEQDHPEPLVSERNTKSEVVNTETHQSTKSNQQTNPNLFDLNCFIEEFQKSSDSVIDKALEEEKDHISQLNNKIASHLQHLENLFMQSLHS